MMLNRLVQEGGVTLNRLVQKPIYVRVCDLLAERIASGEWRPGQIIPNEIELAREIGVSGGTVRKALELMEANRMLTRRQGRGTFVADPEVAGMVDRFCNIHSAEGRKVGGSIQVLEMTKGEADAAEVARLRLAQGAPVWRLRRLRRDGTGVFMYERVVLPVRLFPELSVNGPHRIVALAFRRGLMLGPAAESVTVGAASAEAAAAMSVAVGSPVLLLDRVVSTTEGQPVEWRRAECNPGAGYYQAHIG